ncbi:hypothetical protein N786_03330 [Bacillus amyloliquefaciens UASWS BA1]|nr:hypothetical protein N786_03330 [Bacillus amyloliquefaciens UASWS BA1]
MRKIKKLENVVVPFAGTEIAKGPIFDCGNIVFGMIRKQKCIIKRKTRMATL